MSDDWPFSTAKTDNKKNWNFSEYGEGGGSLGTLNCIADGQVVNWLKCDRLKLGKRRNCADVESGSRLNMTHNQGCQAVDV